MPSNKWDTEYFENEFDEADPWDFESSDYEQKKYTRQIRVLDEHVGGVDSILELGCAEGVHSELLLEAFPDAKLTGIDISSKAIGRARDRLATNRASFVAGNIAEEVAELDQSFDAIVWSETIYYIGDSISTTEMYSLISTVADLLDTGGVLCLANIIEQEDTPETALTREPVLESYRQMIAAELHRVHHAEYTETKAGDKHTYQIWVYTAD